MNEITIRQAREEDVSHILDLYREGEIGYEDAFTPAEARTHLAVFRQYPDYRVFVAELNGEVAGTYELLIMDNLAKRGRKSAIVEDVAVADKHRGCGIGKAMMQHAMQLAKHARCYKIVLSSNSQRAGAHAFYQAQGFQKHGYSFRVEFE